MTVTAETSSVSYTGNGATTAFPVTFYFLSNDHLKVYVDDVLQTLTTHYTVSGAGEDAGGTVTMLTAPIADETIVIERDVPLTQTADLENRGNRSFDVVEDKLDLSIMMAQQLQRQIDDIDGIFEEDLDSLEDRVTVLEGGVDEALNIFSYGALGDGSTNDTVAFQAAIDASAAANRPLRVPAGEFVINGTLDGSYEGLTILGDGPEKTIIRKATGTSGNILDIDGTVPKTNIRLEGITFDTNTRDAGVVMTHVSKVLVRNCEFKNNRVWGLSIGVANGADSAFRNEDIAIENCVFDTSSSTYEHLLLFNSKNVRVSGCKFKTGASAIGIGLYQIIDTVTVEDCRFESLGTASYYSLSCNNITYRRNRVESTTSGIQGANLSDNGAFGYTHVVGLTLEDNVFDGNTDCGANIGAAKNVTVRGGAFLNNSTPGLIINSGGIITPNQAQASNIVIDGVLFKNNNASNIGSINAPGIAFNAIGGAMYARIQNCTFEDDRGTPRQLYPITFVGAYSWSEIVIIDSRLSSYSGAMSVGTSGVTSVQVELVRCDAVSGSLPSGVFSSDELTIKHLGAKGDGTTDDTDAIQNALDVGGVVRVPTGTYCYSALTIPATKAVWFVGEGWGHNAVDGGSVLKHTGAAAGLVIGGTDDDRTCDIRILGLRFMGNGTEVDAAIKIHRTHHVYMEGTRVHLFGDNGVELDRSWACTFVRNYINNNVGNGFEANHQNASILLSRNSFLSNAGKGLHFTAGDFDGTRIENNDFSGNGIGLQLDVGSTLAQPVNIVVEKNYFESQVGANALLGTDAGTYFLHGLAFVNNVIHSGQSTHATNKVVFDRVSSAYINGNQFGNCDIDLTANCSYAYWGKANVLHGDSVRTFVNPFAFDQGVGSITQLGGALPKVELASAGWDQKSRVGLAYRGDGPEFASNLTSSSATEANLDDIAADGFALRLGPTDIRLVTATAGSNPRTLTTVAQWSLDGLMTALLGSVAPKFYVGASTSAPMIFSGGFTPEGAVAAPIGSLFLRTDGGANALYVKESGFGNTGWIGK